MTFYPKRAPYLTEMDAHIRAPSQIQLPNALFKCSNSRSKPPLD